MAQLGAAAPRRARPGAAKRRSRGAVKAALLDALRKKFPTDTVDVSDGYRGNLHVVVVSREFDHMTERERQSMLWRLIDRSGLQQKELDLVSLVYAVSPGELK